MEPLTTSMDRTAPPQGSSNGALKQARVALVILSFVTYVGIEVGSVRLMRSSTGPVATLRARFSDDFVRPSPAVVAGDRGHYRIRLPEGWQLFRDEVARRRNQGADRWLTWPEYDAHLLVVCETLRPEQVIDTHRVLDAMARAVVAASSNTREVARGALPGGDPYLELEGTPRQTNDAFRYLLVAKVNGPEVIQFQVIYPSAAQGAVHDRAVALLRGAEFTPLDTLPFAAAPGEEPPMTFAGPGPLAGARAPYRLDLPARAYLFSEAQARANNPGLDRWIVFSFENVQLFTTAERLGSTRVEMDRFEEFAIQARRASVPGLEIDAREAYPGRPDARLIRYHAPIEGREMHFMLGLVVERGLAMQLTASCPVELCERYEPVILQTMRSLTVAPAGGAASDKPAPAL